MIGNFEFFGVGTVGEKGQIVIPAKAREEMVINPHDEFIFFGKGPMIGLIKASKLDTFFDKITKRFSNKVAGITKMKEKIKKNIKNK